MSELLSDDQLGALLGQAGADVPGTDDEGGAEGASDYGALQRAAARFAERMQSVLTTVLNRKIICDVISCEKTDAAKASGILEGELLAVRLPLSGGLAGELHLLITKKNTAVLSDLMMLGDGSAPYNDDHKDAIGELANQILGSYIAQINGDGLTPPASAGTIEVKECSLSQLPAPAESSAMAVVALSVEGVLDGRSVMLIPDALGRLMASLQPAGQPAQKQVAMQEGVGLSSEELSDLAQVSDLGGMEPSGFTETPLVASRPSSAPKENVDMLLDVDLEVSIELGRASMSVKRILELAPGSIMELDRMAGEPVDLLVNNKVVAKGEVVIVDENFGIRIVSLVSAEDRIRSLR